MLSSRYFLLLLVVGTILLFQLEEADGKLMQRGRGLSKSKAKGKGRKVNKAKAKGRRASKGSDEEEEGGDEEEAEAPAEDEGGEDEEGGGDEEDHGPSGPAKGECFKAYDLETVETVYINAGSQKHCNFTLLGSSKCVPQLTCKNIQLKGDGKECEENYLEIADGWGGNHRACGKTKLDKRGVRASYGARDLFVTVKGHSGGRVQCEATCSTGRSLPDFLGKTKKKKTANCVCGLQNKDDRIVNGEDAKKFEFPWQAAIVTYGTREPMCGASLINDRWILTATHCFWFSNTTASEIQVLLHAHLLDFTLTDGVNEDAELGEKGSIKGAGWDKKKVTDEDERTVRLDIAEIIMHPLFTDGYDFDAALLRLAHPVDLQNIEATPICLPKVGDQRDFVGTTPKVIGWGMPDENAASTTRLLQKLDVPMISNQECGEMMDFDLTERMMCAGFQEGNRDACTGDSGGPLFLKSENGQNTQIGIVSWGEGCARKDRPGVYARVTDLGDWVQYHVRKSNPIWCRESMDENDA